MQESYKSLAKYYDLFYQSKDYAKEVDFISNIISKYRPDATKLLDVGCGTGKHLNMLKDNFDILYGIDLNQEIINIAKIKSPQIKYIVSGMSDFKIKIKFDVITCLYSVFNYNLTIEDAEKAIKNFKKHLNIGGILIIALYKPTNTKKEISIHVGKDQNVEVAKINQFSVDKNTSMEISNFITIIKKDGKIDFSIENDHKMKIFHLKELTLLLKKNKFKNIKIYNNFSDKYASSKSKYPVFIGINH